MIPITLYFTLGPSDKEYRLEIVEREDRAGWDCVAHHGKRDRTLRSTVKNKTPLTHEEARALYSKVLHAQVAQGYTTDPSGRPGSHPLLAHDLLVGGEPRAFSFRSSLPRDQDPDSASEDDLIRIGVGQPTLFRPAGLPVPAWCAVVNPMGPDDPATPVSERDLNMAFEAYSVDATITVINGAEPTQVIGALWEAANQDAADHAECDNGGAYALWVLSEGRLAVGGFDNGGSDIAQTEADLIACRLGTVVASLSAAHFDPGAFQGENHPTEPKGREAVALVMAAGTPVAPVRGRRRTP